MHRKLNPAPTSGTRTQYTDHFWNLPNRFKSRWRYGRTMPPQHCRTASRTQTETCLKRRPGTTTIQTWVHWNCFHQKVHWWCDSHQDNHHTCKLEAMNDSGGSWAAKDEAEMKHSDQEIKQPSKQQEPIYSVASKMPVICWKKSMITSQRAETHGAGGKPFRPSLTTSPATGLWWWHIPPRFTRPLLFVWNAEWHTCTKTAHTSQRPGAQPT